jgi:hypothetical protein
LSFPKARALAAHHELQYSCPQHGRKIQAVKRNVIASWRTQLETRSYFNRIVFLFFLGAIIVVGIYGRQSTLGYILLLIALPTVIVLRALWLRRNRSKATQLE